MNPDTTRQPDIVVLGAGLTGMSAALELSSRGAPFRIFEKLAYPGGHAITVAEQGYRFDRTGHLLHLRHEAIRSKVLSWLGPDYVVIQRQSRVWSHGVYTRYPFQANTFGLPPEVAYECVLDFIEAHKNPPAHEPKNFEEFCYAHFGAGISRHFMIPYNTKLWGVSPREITADWCQRFVPLPRLSDVIAGAVGLNDRELGYNQNFIYPHLGIGELTRCMHERLPNIELERPPRRIRYRSKQVVFDDEVIPYRVLVNTMPLPILLGLLEDPPAEVQQAAAKLRATHLYYLDVALRTPCRQPIHWAYVPEAQYPFYRVGCYSHFSSAMAPDGGAGLYVELAQREKPDMNELMPRVTDNLIKMKLIEQPDDVAFARLRRIDHAYVIFDHDYFEALGVIEPFLGSAGIISTGRYGGWNYSSMEDALVFGQNAALASLEHLEA